jgi:ribosomal protein S12 methylthiotransferase accessory factor
MVGRDRREMFELQQRLTAHEAITSDAWASRTGLMQMACLLTAEAHRVLEGKQPHLEGRVFLINLNTLESSRHFFLPNPMCPVCGQLPDDSPAKAQISLQPRPKSHAGSYRSRSIDEL